MSGINGVGHNQPVQRVINNPVLREVNTTSSTPTSTPASHADRVELSGVGHFIQSLKSAGDVRTEKVADIKKALDAGTYEDDQKLDAAIDKLLDDING